MDDDLDGSIIRKFLVDIGLEDTEDNQEQISVFIACMHMYEERTKKYGQLWKKCGWSDSVHHIRHKAARIWQMFGKHQDADPVPGTDDLFDMINYSAFALRNIVDGNKYGD